MYDTSAARWSPYSWESGGNDGGDLPASVCGGDSRASPGLSGMVTGRSTAMGEWRSDQQSPNQSMMTSPSPMLYGGDSSQNAGGRDADVGLMRLPNRPREEEDAMQEFIRSRMMSMLHPVAEHVRELHGLVHGLRETMGTIDAKADRARDEIGKYAGEFASVRSNICLVDSRLDKTRVELSMTHREKGLLQTDVEDAKQSIGKVHSKVQGADASLKLLQQQMAHVDQNFQIHQLNTFKTAAGLEDHIPRLKRLEESVEDLDARQLNAVANLETEEAYSKSVDVAFRAFVRTYHKAERFEEQNSSTCRSGR
jgi:hypothetical protein